MSQLAFVTCLAFAITTASFCHAGIAPTVDAIPSIESLSVEWENMPIRAMPLVQNFHGAATLRRDAQPGFGMVSLGPITSAPFNGNFQNSTIAVDGKTYRVANTTMGWCTASRRAVLDDGGSFENVVRLPFERHGLMQRWRVERAQVNISMTFDGPFYRQCDTVTTQGTVWAACGWGTSMPVDRSSYRLDIQQLPGTDFQVMLVSDTLTSTVAASVVLPITTSSDTQASVTIAKNDDFQFDVTVVASSASASEIELGHVTMVATSADEAVRDLVGVVASLDAVWEDSCGLFEERWRAAFSADATPSRHFSGALPVMQTSDPQLDRLYYWAALAMVSLERTNFETSPREFVISEGPSNSLDGSADMGGSGQFVWDLSFASLSMSLLEPNSTRRLASYLIRYSNLTADPMLLPQSWDGFREMPAGLGEYAFDYMATFFFIHQYISHSGNYGFLTQSFTNALDPTVNITAVEFLRRLSWSWRGYPKSCSSPFLVDYGSNKRSFLEAVPSYTNVIPVLQFGNAGMLLSLSKLLEGDPSQSVVPEEEVEWMRGNATAIVEAAVEYQYHNGTGFWDCLYPSQQQGKDKRGGVRAISDFGYLGIALGVMSDGIDLLPDYVRTEAVQYFMSELLANGWVRALSLEDPVMSGVGSLHPSLEDKVAMRADWTGTGAYGGLAGIATDTLSVLETDFSYTMETLRNISLASRVSMPAQGVAVMSPPFIMQWLDGNDGLPAPQGPFAPAFPEFFDEPNWPPFWPSSLRSVQNAEASIVDSIIRSVFGWRPHWSLDGDDESNGALDPSQAVDDSLFRPSISRGEGFSGSLSGLRTPYGVIDVSIVEGKGLEWRWSRRESDGGGSGRGEVNIPSFVGQANTESTK